ncbi:MAG TPA: hypothetical protein VF723_03655 [Pyrinomonadaceae bacterium]|jgi:hypothetical protein
MASKYLSAYRMIALALVFSIAQVYVMAGPIKALNDPRTPNTPATAQPTGDPATSNTLELLAANRADSGPAISSETTDGTTAKERMGALGRLTLTPNPTLARVFARQNVETRLAANNNFLKSHSSLVAMLKMPKAQTSGGNTQDTSGDDNDNSGARSAAIAAAIIGAGLVVAFIGFRHDRNNNGENGQ